MNTERIIELEAKLAYLELGQEALSDALATQQKQLDVLLTLCRQLAQRGHAAPESESNSFSLLDEKPPHY